jgi:hypothetical protein
MVEYDKRRQRRLKVIGPIVIVTSSGRQIEAQAINVSLLGCRFTSLTRLDVGEQLSTTLCFPAGGSHRVEGTIRSVRGSSPYQRWAGLQPTDGREAFSGCL